MRKFIAISLLLFHLPGLGQESKKYIREGNDMYFEGKYAEAEESYQKALAAEPKSYKGAFNKADALYKLEKYEEAANQFRMLAEKADGKKAKASAYHNLGNSLLQSKKFKESIDAYKHALRNNPEDNDTRYNLAYAQMMLKQQQQQEQDKQDEKKDEKKKDEEKKEEKKDKQDKNKEQEQQKKQQPQNQLSKKDAERLLDALNNEEKRIQENLKRQKTKAVKVKIEKDW